MTGKSSPSGPNPKVEKIREEAKPTLEAVIARTEAGRTDQQRKDLADTLVDVLGENWDQLINFVKPVEDETYPIEFEQLLHAEIAQIDQEISEKLDAVMHAPEFKSLEASWRGLHSFVMQTELTDMIKIRVLNATKKDLAKDLLKGDYLESELFRKVHDTGYGVLGGEPYGALIGDFEFGLDDVALLTKIAAIAAIVHSPFVSAASPKMFGLEDFTKLSSAGPLFNIFRDKAYAEWQAFRAKPDSRYVGLVLPHVLGRKPYGRSADADIFEFQYAENVAGPDPSKYLWVNAAYAYGQCLTGAFFDYQWCTAIGGVEGGGLVELPFHTFAQDGLTSAVGPTEVSITDPRELELSDQGFMGLVQQINTPMAVFMSGHSCQAPDVYYSDETTASANLSAKLPNIFATSRFAHYLKVIMRDKIASFMSRKQCEDFLNGWIGNYVTTQEDATQAYKAAHPLREARVEVEDVPGQPGTYRAIVHLLPHYQLQKIAISLRLVANLPKRLRSS